MKQIDVNGVALSEIALGAGGRGDIADDQKWFAVMDHYMEYGGRTFDSARMYGGGKSDEALGRWLKGNGLRDEITIVAKGCFPDHDTMHIPRLSPQDIKGDLELSLKAMGTDHSDLYLLHRDCPTKPVSEIMPPLHELIMEGKTRAIGCSNWTVGRIIEANLYAEEHGLTPFSLCQLHYSLALTTAAQTGDITHVPMADVEFGWYKESQFPIMGFGAQGRGYFKRLLNGEELRAGDWRYYNWIPENRKRAERLATLSRELGRSPAALLVAYTRDAGLNCVPLCAYSSAAQMDEAFDALNFSLTPEQIAYLDGKTA
ncbi:MAG: aldo/keto reductase [Clostridia bacterium]|nr:aldo/keto reductase [Clostridia bacterium]